MKKNIIKNSQKIIAIIMLLCISLGITQPIMAASGTGRYTGGQFASYIRTAESSGEYGVLIRFILDLDTNERKTAFCTEYGVAFDTGPIYNGSYFTPTNPDMKHACKIAYFGWYSNYGDYIVNGGMSNDAKKDYAFTQVMIWEYLGQNSGTFLSSTNQNEYNDFKANINAKISAISQRPSFNATSIDLDVGDTKVLTDTNNVLKDYQSIDKIDNGIRFQHTYGENTLTITATDSCDVENYTVYNSTAISWGLIKADSVDHDTTLYYSFPSGAQSQLYSLHYNDPVSLTVDLKINLAGNLEITKTNVNGDLLDGTIFNLTGPNGYNQNHTVSGGKLLIEKLKKGSYVLKEQNSVNGYLLNVTPYNVTIIPNQTVSQTVVNEEPTGTISLVKKDKETGSVSQRFFDI